MKFYSDWAVRIAGGQWTDHQAFYGLPLYAYLLAALYATIGFVPYIALFLQVLADSVVGLLVYRLAPLAFSRDACSDDEQRHEQNTNQQAIGLLAALGWALFVPAQAYSTILMPTTYFVAAFWFVVWWTLRERKTPLRAREFFLLGLFMGFVAMMVANILFLAGFVLAALFFRRAWAAGLPGEKLARWRARAIAAILLFGGIGLGASPCWLHNYFVAGEPVLLSAHSGINFWIGNNPQANGYPKIPDGMRADQEGLLKDSITFAEKQAGHPMRRYEVSAYWSGKAHQYIADHPAAFARLLGVKLRNFWNGYQFDDLGVIIPMQEDGVLVPGIGFGVVAALGLPGIFLALWRRPRARWLVAAVLLHMASLLPVFITERYRMAAVPGLLLLASFGLVECARLLASQRWVPSAAYAVLAAVAFAIVQQPPPDRDLVDLTDYNTGIADLENQHFDRARPKLERVFLHNPTNAEAVFAMGNLSLAENKNAAAMRFYSRTLELDPQHHRAMNNLGVLAMEDGQWRAAQNLFTQALVLAPDDAKAHYLLARTCVALHDPAGARHAIDAAIQLEPHKIEYQHFREELEKKPGVRQLVSPSNSHALAHFPAVSPLLDPSASALTSRMDIVPSVARHLPPVTLPALSTRAKGLLWLVLALFCASVAFRLNGSSSCYLHYAGTPDIVLHDAPHGLLLGDPQGVRSDEYLVCTPAMLSQARALPSFPVSNLSYGAGKAPLLMSLPARHYTMIFRPGLWAFFVAPFEWAFSWYWNLKIFGLFAALFGLFWVLTQGRFGLAVMGTLLVQYSGYFQWWFSSPAMLPEMLAAWALGIVAALGLFTTVAQWRRTACAALLVACLASFFLCCYPPWQIPLFYLAAIIVAGYVWQYHLPVKRGLPLLGLGIIGAVLALVPWFLDCRSTLELVANTEYPGHRLATGGSLSLDQFFSGLFSLAISERNVPRALPNICEASNFYPFWWVPMLAGGFSLFRSAAKAQRQPGDSAGKTLCMALGRGISNHPLKVRLSVYVLMLTWYILGGLPGWFCSLTLLSRCTEQRMLLPVGLAGVILLVVCVPSLPLGRWKQRRIDAVLMSLAWSAGAFWFLLECRARMPEFLVPGRIAFLGGAAVLIVLLYLWVRPVFSVATLLVLLMWQTALINPVCVGLPELTQSKALVYIRGMVQADPSAAWASYDNLWGTEMVKACGGYVLDGLRAVPDFTLMRDLDPESKNASAYNRYVHLVFQPQAPNEEPKFRLYEKVYCLIKVPPRHLAVLYPKLRYVISVRRIADFAEQGLQPVEADFSGDHIWLYRVLRDTDNASVEPHHPAIVPDKPPLLPTSTAQAPAT